MDFTPPFRGAGGLTLPAFMWGAKLPALWGVWGKIFRFKR